MLIIQSNFLGNYLEGYMCGTKRNW